MRASLAVRKAIEWGYTDVYYFRDGFIGWRARGLPIETIKRGDIVASTLQ
ncbi:MAG: hypothetical protein AAF541_22960 [Pseudomonadota bacterium]